MAAGVKALVVNSTDDVSTTESSTGFITGSGPNYTSTVTPEGNTQDDRLTFGEGGSVEYESEGSQKVKIESTKKNDDGTYDSVTVEVEGGQGDGNVNVKVTRTEYGEAQVEVEGAPDGAEVKVTVKSKDDGGQTNTQSVSYTSNGEDSSAKVDPDSGDRLSPNAPG
jgi:hypothetical protein